MPMESRDPKSIRFTPTEWDAIRALTHILATAKQGNRAEARDALQAARAVGYQPRSDTERRLLRECEATAAGN